MSNSSANNLNTFKEQIASIIKEINNFDGAEKNEALTYLKECIDSDTSLESVSALKKAEVPCLEKQNTNGITCSSGEISIKTSDTQFKCEQCDKSFKRKCDLSRHANVHSTVRTHICLKCDVTFKQKEQLSKHEQTIHKHETDVELLQPMKNEPIVEMTVENCTSNEINSSNLVNNTINSRRLRRRVSFKPKLLEKFSSTLANVVKRAVLKCKVCDEIKKTKVDLFQHLETHIGTPLSCMKCRHKFNSRYAYDWHLTYMCKYRAKLLLKNKYKCSQCPKVFKFHVHYKTHVEAHKRNNCTYCDVVLTHRKQLVDHLQLVHSIKLERAKFKCKYCGKTYVKKLNYHHHLKQHVIGKEVCLECGLITDDVDEFRKHLEHHRSQKRWQCNKCLDKFTRRQQLLTHLKKHELYKCITCAKSCSSKNRLFQHKQLGHEVTGLEPPLRCPHCPQAFYRKLNLQLHLRKHSDDKPQIQCKYCKISFRTPYQYFNHLLTKEHEKNSPEINQLVCESCGKQFTKKYLLADHFQRVHFTQKYHNCQYCDFKSNNKTNLRRHVSLHLTTKPEFVCEQCGKGFSNLATLRDHVSYIHVQERQFKCDQCDKSFKRNAELNRHRSIHSDLRPFVCDICSLGYKRRTHLRRHEESVHDRTVNNRRVQRLVPSTDGTLVPVPPQKKKPKKQKPKNAATLAAPQPASVVVGGGGPLNNGDSNAASEQQLFSIVNAQSGEMFTFTMYELDSSKYQTVVYNQDLFNAESSPSADNLSIVDQLVNNYLPGDKGIPSIADIPAAYQDFAQAGGVVSVGGAAAANAATSVNAAANLQSYGGLEPPPNVNASNNVIISSRLVENAAQSQGNAAAAAALNGIADFATYQQRSTTDFWVNFDPEN